MVFNSDNETKENLEKDPIKQIDEMVEPFDPEKPESVLFHFFLNILKGECNKAWRLFTKYSQQKILDNSYEEMQNNDEFYFQNEITSKEDLRKAFEENHKGLKPTFWLNFAISSNAEFMVEYGEYRAKSIKNNKTTVEVVFKRKDGLETKLPFQMFYEESSWKLGIVESAAED